MQRIGMVLMIVGWTAMSLHAQPTDPPLPATPGSATPAIPVAGEVTQIVASASYNLEEGKGNRTLIVQAQLAIPQNLDVVGMTHQVQMRELISGSGEDLLTTAGGNGQIILNMPRFYTSTSRLRQMGNEQPITVRASVSGLKEIPSRIALLRGRTYLLVASRRVTQELAPIRVGSIFDLTKHVSIQIIELKQEGRSVELTFQYNSDRASPFFDLNNEPPVIDAIRLVDDKGDVVDGRGSAPQRKEEEQGVFEGTGQVSFVLENERKPRALRFDVIVELEERAVEFEARDVAMPVLPSDAEKPKSDAAEKPGSP